jgi:hypothetical protein
MQYDPRSGTELSDSGEGSGDEVRTGMYEQGCDSIEAARFTEEHILTMQELGRAGGQDTVSVTGLKVHMPAVFE